MHECFLCKHGPCQDESLPDPVCKNTSVFRECVIQESARRSISAAKLRHHRRKSGAFMRHHVAFMRHHAPLPTAVGLGPFGDAGYVESISALLIRRRGFLLSCRHGVNDLLILEHY
jgi:hypothetical protein